MNQAAQSTAGQNSKPGLPASLTSLRGVGPALAEKLARLGVNTPEDLLFILPIRYEDRTRITAIGSLVPGQRAVIEAEVELSEVVFRRRRSLLCRVSDGTGSLTLRFFYFSPGTAARPGPRQKAALLRRSAKRPGRTRDHPSGIPGTERYIGGSA